MLALEGTVERAFASLKGRFKRLQLETYHDYCNNNYCFLHNICILDHFEDYLVDVEQDNVNDNVPGEDFNHNGQEAAAVKRLAMARRLLN